MFLKRKRIGTVLPVTSLVSKTTEDGTFYAGEKFIDWLVKSKQNAWQVLPLHQTQLEKNSSTKHIPSPYKGYGIGLDPIFLTKESRDPSDKELAGFIKNNNYWLDNYTLFCSLRDYFGTDRWSKWPTDIRNRDKNSIKKWQEKLNKEINKHTIIQAQLYFSYKKLQKKASKNEIILIGDLPLYLGLNSPLVWQFQDLFEINEDGKLEKTSGVIKSKKSYFGRQVWGHPLYKWQEEKLIHKLEKIFKIRLRYLANLFDWVRLDHAKGLFVYDSIDLKGEKLDKPLKGPGTEFLGKITSFAHQQNLNIYAEDTGGKLKELRECLKYNKIPGIKIFKYSYDEKKKKFTNQYLEIDKYHSNTFAYTTTHDTETLISYLQKLSKTEINILTKKINIQETADIKLLAKLIINKVINSPAKTVIIPIQDWLYTTDRINTPGTEKEIDDSNWQYKMTTPIEDLPTDLYKLNN